MSRHPVIQEDISQVLQTQLPWEKFFGKTVLVTGAAGFLPAYMIETFLMLNEQNPEAQVQVIALVRNHKKATVRFAGHHGRKDIIFLVQNVCQPLQLDMKVDFIIHAASQASPKHFGVDPVGTLSANVLGTANLLEFSRTFKCEGFLFFSSSEVYGAVNDSNIPTSEEHMGSLDPANVRSCYGESKRMGENMCVSWTVQYGVPTSIVRPFHTYGPGMSLTDGRVFADFVADILENKDIVMKSDGSALRAFCYLADAVSGFFTVLLKGVSGQPYNIGNPDAECSILELAQRLVQLFPEKRLRVLVNPSKRTDSYLVSPVSRNLPNISKARQLGWNPTADIESGFGRTIRSYQ